MDHLDEYLTPDDRLSLSRIVILPTVADGKPLELPEGYNHVSPPDSPQIITHEFLGLEIRRAFVFKSDLPVRAVELV